MFLFYFDQSLLKYAERTKNTITIGSNLQGGIKTSNKLSSILLPVFLIKTFSLVTIKFAIKVLKTKEVSIRIKKIKYWIKFNPKKLILIKSKNVIFNEFKISTICSKLL